MNPITDALFTVTWFLLLIWAGRSILRGWSKPVRNFNAGTWTTQVTKRVHPEMEGVEPGEELMGVTFDRRTSCDIEEYNELQERINGWCTYAAYTQPHCTIGGTYRLPLHPKIFIIK